MGNNSVEGQAGVTMRRLTALSALVVACLAVFTGGHARADRGDFGGDAQEAGKHGWLASYQEGLEQARKLRKPMMLVFRCVP